MDQYTNQATSAEVIDYWLNNLSAQQTEYEEPVPNSYDAKVNSVVENEQMLPTTSQKPRPNRTEVKRTALDRKRRENKVHQTVLRSRFDSLAHQINKYEGVQKRSKIQLLAAATRILRNQDQAAQEDLTFFHSNQLKTLIYKIRALLSSIDGLNNRRTEKECLVSTINILEIVTENQLLIDLVNDLRRDS